MEGLVGENVSAAGPTQCTNCETQTTPMWRRQEDGTILCNACGLYLKLHGKARDVTLRTNVIKSRNRVKAVVGTASRPNGAGSAGQQNNDQKAATGNNLAVRQSLPATHASAKGVVEGPARTWGKQAHRQRENPAPQDEHGIYAIFNTAEGESVSAQDQQVSNGSIAPQHMFDSVSAASILSEHAATQPFGQMYPDGTNAYENDNGYVQSDTDLRSENSRLRTRVTELEFVNNLYQDEVAKLRGRLEEAEAKLLQEAGSRNLAWNEADLERARKRTRVAEAEPTNEGAVDDEPNHGTAETDGLGFAFDLAQAAGVARQAQVDEEPSVHVDDG